MSKMSDRLEALVKAPDFNQQVNLHVMLKKDLSRENAQAVARDLTRLAADEQSVEVLPASGIILLCAPIGTVQKIAARAEVVWIDIDSTAPLEALLDA